MDITKDTAVRCFVAVEIPAPIQELLKPVQTDLQSHIRKGTSWTKPGNFHFTLKFLGDVRPEKIDVVSEVIQRVADTHSPFSIEFGGIGAFPNLARPRVIWVGITEGASVVSQLAKTMNLELAHLGFPTDNRFHPHLTLARLRTAMNLEPLKNVLRKYNTINDAAMSVNEITLIQSQLHPSGAVYTPLRLCQFSV